MNLINTLKPDTGRELKEDGSVFNVADAMSNALDPLGGVTISDEQQHAIHAGDAYSYCNNGSIAAGGTYTLVGRAGARQVHFDGMNISAQSGGIQVEFIEAPTVTVLGTLQTVHRKNRATVKAVTMLVYGGSTVTGGTVIFNNVPPIVAGQGNKLQSSVGGVVEGWVLAQNTDYAIRLTNTTNATATFDANFGWHEPTIILS